MIHLENLVSIQALGEFSQKDIELLLVNCYDLLKCNDKKQKKKESVIPRIKMINGQAPDL